MGGPDIDYFPVEELRLPHLASARRRALLLAKPSAATRSRPRWSLTGLPAGGRPRGPGAAAPGGPLWRGLAGPLPGPPPRGTGKGSGPRDPPPPREQTEHCDLPTAHK